MGDPASATTPSRASSATPPSSRPTRAGRTRHCSAAAPRTRCGTTSSTTTPCAPSSPSASRPPPRAATCWRAPCSRSGDRDGAAALVRHAWRYEDCSAEVEKQSARDVRRHAHARRSQGAHGQRFYADDAEAGLRAAERLGGNDLADREGAHRGHQAHGQRQGAARRRAGRRAQATPAISSRARSGCANTIKPEEAGALILTAPHDPAHSVRIPINGGWSAACWCASCSTTAMRRPPIASRAMPRRRRSGNYRVDQLFHGRLDRAALPARRQDCGRSTSRR